MKVQMEYYWNSPPLDFFKSEFKIRIRWSAFSIFQETLVSCRFLEIYEFLFLKLILLSRVTLEVDGMEAEDSLTLVYEKEAPKKVGFKRLKNVK